MRNLFKPRHTLASVMEDLISGFDDGSIVLDSKANSEEGSGGNNYRQKSNDLRTYRIVTKIREYFSKNKE